MNGPSDPSIPLASLLGLFGGGGQDQAPAPPMNPPAMQMAASPVFQISPRQNGQYAVINVQTGQTVHVGSLDSARNAQASAMAANSRRY